MRLVNKTGRNNYSNGGLGLNSERVTSNKISLKEGTQAMAEIKNFEKMHGLKKLGPPVNKYPQVMLEQHYEMGKKFFSN